MMTRRQWIAVALALPGLARAQDDSGRAPIGAVAVSVYHATDGDPAAAGKSVGKVPESLAKRLRAEPQLRFQHYRLLGSDTRALLRSYENWAEPLKPANELLVRFEAQGRPSTEGTVVDLELWVARKKIVKTDARLARGRPLFLLGPEWRGGRLIVAVELAETPKAGSS